MSVAIGRYCQNGYPVLEPVYTGPLPRLRRYTLPGANRTLNLRDGATGFLLAHFVLWFSEVLEPLDGPGNDYPDEAGHNVRQIAGSDDWSNHSGGLAVDLNWQQHPLGAVGTFTPAEVRAIHRRFALYEGCLRWGGDYRNRKDEMHIEVIALLEECERVAKLLAHSPRGKRILRANPGLWTVINS